MTVNIKVKTNSEPSAFVKLLNLLRKMGSDIISMRPSGGYMIVTCVLGKKQDYNWVNTCVLRSEN